MMVEKAYLDHAAVTVAEMPSYKKSLLSIWRDGKDAWEIVSFSILGIFTLFFSLFFTYGGHFLRNYRR